MEYRVSSFAFSTLLSNIKLWFSLLKHKSKSRFCFQKWKKSMEKDQREAPLSEKPKVTVEDIATKIQALDREVNYLLNKAKMFRPKPKKEEKNSTKSSNTTEKTDSETDKTSTNDTKGR